MRAQKWLAAGALAGVIVGTSLAIGLSPRTARGTAGPTPARPPDKKPAAPRHVPSAAYQWLDIALEATAREHERVAPRPTVGSRMLAIVVTAMYDAWAAYDDKAVGTRLGGKLRRPRSERALANKEKAIGHAAYRALLYLFPEDGKWLAEQMRKQGLSPKDNSTDTTTPQGVGNVAAAALIAYRRNDGANQNGNEVGSNGKPYSDFTYYRPINPIDKVIDPDCWQPIPFEDGKGRIFYPGFLTAHWYRVKPFALKRSDQFRPAKGPPRVGSKKMKEEVEEVVRMNANLTVKQKAIVEFMRDGPKSTGQSGHWLRFAQDVSRRDRNGIDEDVKLFFSVGNVVFDAFIACWDAKRYYDSSRPWLLVRHYNKGKKLDGWAGPGKGVITLPAEKWRPYSPASFPTPPFPGYPSGHSTASGAGSKMLELFTGSDRFGVVERRKAGALTEPGFPCAVIQMRHGKPPAEKMTLDVELPLPTFSATAEIAGISRILGGYHIQADNIVGLEMGRKIAVYSWPKYQAYFNGTKGRR
jgi:hypothetical protein